MAKIYVFLADGCEEIEALTPVDLLRRAGEDVCTVSIMGRKEVKGSHKITILADETIEEGEFDDGDMLVLPGGMPGTLNLAGNETLAALIRSYDDQGKKLAAICAAPSILGVMGILKDKNAVCQKYINLCHGFVLLCCMISLVCFVTRYSLLFFVTNRRYYTTFFRRRACWKSSSI